MKPGALNNLYLLLIVVITIVCVACSGKQSRIEDSIGSLSSRKLKIEETEIEQSLEKAVHAYRDFLSESDVDSDTTPEALRRLADLQLEQETLIDNVEPSAALAENKKATKPIPIGQSDSVSSIQSFVDQNAIQDISESRLDFEKRTTRIADLESSAKILLPEYQLDKKIKLNGNTNQAISIYRSLLKKYPSYKRNDQVMYQLARAYETIGRQDEARTVLDKLVEEYPTSIHTIESQFRRGEILFVNRQYEQAKLAYSEVIQRGTDSVYFDRALFKRGWCSFKQGAYKEALNNYIELLDIKSAAGYHIKTDRNSSEHQRVEDTFRVVSLSFSYMGGAESVKKYFNEVGSREYEYLVYAHLAEHYLSKRRFQDAASIYQAFFKRYPLHTKSPEYHIRTIEIYKQAWFPGLIVEAKRQFAIKYDLKGIYWNNNKVEQHSDVLVFLKKNLNDLATHFHALSQQEKDSAVGHQLYIESARWYRAFLDSFPGDEQAPAINFLFAELLYENSAFREAAEEYERTAYDYTRHSKSAESAYAAVLAYREHEKQAAVELRAGIHQELIRASLRFADTYPDHKQAAAVLTVTAESLYLLKDYARAVTAAEKVTQSKFKVKQQHRIACWVVLAHSYFDLGDYNQAELAYSRLLRLLAKHDSRIGPIIDKLAASIYRQAEQRQATGDNNGAIRYFLRIAAVAPNSPIAESGGLDAAAILISMQEWRRAEEVLQILRRRYPVSNRKLDVATKLALVFEKSGKTVDAAAEYERISRFTNNLEVKQAALLKSADLYAEAEQRMLAIGTYKRFIASYPEQVEPVAEVHKKLADMYLKMGHKRQYRNALQKIIMLDRNAGLQRTDRTKYLAASAQFELTGLILTAFKNARLGEPFQETLARKKRLMQKGLKAYADVAAYQVADLTAATTYQIADIYFEFSQALLKSERPANLSGEELIQYELLLEEQAYPFEEKAINVHKKNIDLMTTGVYNQWIIRSLKQLAQLVPARYAKEEKEESFFASVN